MKRALVLFLPLWFFVASSASAANVDVGINVNVGLPTPAIVVPAPAIVVTSPPEFLLIPTLGLHISIGAPYDLFYLDGHYYHFHKNRWYRSSDYRGSWVYVDPGHLPKRLRNHNYREMLDWRDRDYKEYKKDRNKHRDRYFRADDRQEERKERREGHKEKHKGNHGHKEK